MCNGMVGASGSSRVVDFAFRRTLPVGVESFSQTVTNCVFVDKSLLIAELLERTPGTSVLFCRPRRFGKSLALSMLRCYFEKPVDGWVEDNSHLFDGLSISDVVAMDQNGPCAQTQGVHPVLYLNLKGASSRTWMGSKQAIAEQIATECSRHWYVYESPTMTPHDRKRFESLAEGDAQNPALEGSLAFLTRILSCHHSSGCVLLIDEYDHPVSYGHAHGYRTEATDFMRQWLTGGLKGNDALFLGVLTGVQRVSRESVFSGLNNLLVNTSMDHDFSEAFGFTDDEVEHLCSYLGLNEALPDIRNWYDGYNFGGTPIYNPWSVVSCLQQAGACQPYWTNTSGNDVVRELFVRTIAEGGRTASDLRTVADGGTIEHSINLATIFDDLDREPESIWGLLYLTGYVTSDVVDAPNDGRKVRALRAPNLEVRRLWLDEFLGRAEYLAGGPSTLMRLHKALLGDNPAQLEYALEEVLLGGPSYLDLRDEGDYHLLLLGLFAGLPGYMLPESDRERGFGRADITLEPSAEKTKTLPAIVIECKRMRGEEAEDSWTTKRQAKLEDLCAEAILQTTDRDYGHGLVGAGRKIWGIAFCGKHVACALA